MLSPHPQAPAIMLLLVCKLCLCCVKLNTKEYRWRMWHAAWYYGYSGLLTGGWWVSVMRLWWGWWLVCADADYLELELMNCRHASSSHHCHTRSYGHQHAASCQPDAGRLSWAFNRGYLLWPGLGSPWLVCWPPQWQDNFNNMFVS